jgi:peptidoglycan/LPS O-acetylase OafA/YrhL
LAVRIVNYALRQEYSYHTHAFATHLRLDSLLFGVAIAYAYHFHADWFRRTFQPKRYTALLIGTFLFTCWMYVPYPGRWYGDTFGFTHMYLAAGAIMVGVLMCKIPENRLTRLLAGLGACSYSIYLWHMAFIRWAAPSLSSALSWQARTALYFVAAFALGLVMARIVELPFLKIRDRIHPSRLTENTTPMPAAPTKAAA